MKETNFKKIAFGLIALASLGLIAAIPLVSAYQGDPSVKGPNYDAEIHDMKVDALNSNDFATWKDLMEQSGARGRVLEVVNEDNFNTFVEAHNAAMAGDMELANKLRSELGLNNGVGPRDGTGHRGEGMGEGHGRNHEGRGEGNQANFVDSDGDGACDNMGSHRGMGRGRR